MNKEIDRQHHCISGYNGKFQDFELSRIKLFNTTL